MSRTINSTLDCALALPMVVETVYWLQRDRNIKQSFCKQQLLDVTQESHSSEDPMVRRFQARQPQRRDVGQIRAIGFLVHGALKKQTTVRRFRVHMF
jgi:hypothetical protein